ncbi:MAG TPA: hypothetical protein VN428_05785 [Bryobacteraceae bacterium]|nr:hypothetical protein [Bryobacteraceae bacterium]
MKRLASLFALCIFAGICVQSKPAPGSVQVAQFERIVQQAQQDPSLGQKALEVLRSVAEGHAEHVSRDAASRFALMQSELQGPSFKFTTVRLHAFRTIGKLGTAAAIAFLEQVTPDQFRQDEVYQLWPAAQIALREALLNRISDPRRKTEFLEKTLTERRDAIADGTVDSWAVEELCNSGTLNSLPAVQRWIEESFSTPNVQVDKVSFCEQRMRVMMRDSDAVAAIASVLSVSNNPIDRRLTQWAVNQLEAMKASRADEALYRFEAEILSLPDGSVQKDALRTYSVQIRDIRIGRVSWPVQCRGAEAQIREQERK